MTLKNLRFIQLINMPKFKRQAGFTLVETISYISIVGTILLALMAFFGVMLEARNKTQAIAEVNQQGQQILLKLEQTLRNATLINSPASATTANTLSINQTNSALNPTVINLSGNNLQYKEGAASAINLNSNRINVSNLTFTNAGYASTKGAIRIQFTLSHVNPDAQQELTYTQTFYGTVALR